MTTEGPQLDTRPLFGPDGRIPGVRAVTLPARQTGIRGLREGWLPRHSVAMLLLTPTLLGVYLASLATPLTVGWALLVGAMALMAALIATTYLPLRGAVAGPASSCSFMAGTVVPMVAVLLSGATSYASGAMSLALLTVALAQRLSGTSSCR